MKENRRSVSGILEEIRFHQNNYLIGKLDSSVAVKGSMISPQIGLEYEFQGQWHHHPEWGDTFVFNEYRASYPKSLDAIRSYLMENCKWIGPEISKRLVNTFGEHTLPICKTDPERIARKISGITKRRALEISAMLKNNEANEELQLELKTILTGINVSKRALVRIIQLYGQESPGVIRKNPYRLIDDIEGIGFLTADMIAKKVGFEAEGTPRISAGVVYVLKESVLSGGHTCLSLKFLLSKARDILKVSDERIQETIEGMIARKRVVRIEDYIYLPKFYEDEKSIAEELKILNSQGVDCGSPKLDGLYEDQVKAIHKVLENNLFVLTGPPGVGKTFTIKRIIESFPQTKIALAAPTGRGAKRMYEESGMPAKTIHKLLEPMRGNKGFYFTRNKDNPIKADLIILDEVSMIDVSLMASFLDAVAPGTRLIMVGDSYQLPSIGPGNILKDMIASGVIPYQELTIIKRQDEGLIIRSCHNIKNGQDIELGNSTAKDFFFLRRDREESIRDTILDLITNRLIESYNVDPLRDIQIISPLREKTILSCKALNEECQKRLNLNPSVNSSRFKKGDKVIQTKNQYELDIINGDIGYIRSINPKERTIYVDFKNPDRFIHISLENNNLELAYATTIHKFQGSEAPIVIIPIHRCFGTLITQRNLLYTAVSRAKKVCILVGQREEIPKMIRRNQQQRRFTNLARFLREEER